MLGTGLRLRFSNEQTDEIPALTELPSCGRRKTKSQINKRCGQKVVSARTEKSREEAEECVAGWGLTVLNGDAGRGLLGR